MSDSENEDFPVCSDGLGELPLPGPPFDSVRSIDQAGIGVTLEYDDGMGDFPPAAPDEPRKPIWAQRKDVSDLWNPPTVVKHNRKQVITHDGRHIEFEQIWWTNGYKVVSAYDETFGRMLHHFFSQG